MKEGQGRERKSKDKKRDCGTEIEGRITLIGNGEEKKRWWGIKIEETITLIRKSKRGEKRLRDKNKTEDKV